MTDKQKEEMKEAANEIIQKMDIQSSNGYYATSVSGCYNGRTDGEDGGMKCNNMSIGGRKCMECLAKELDELLESDLGSRLMVAHEKRMDAWRAIIKLEDEVEGVVWGGGCGDD